MSEVEFKSGGVVCRGVHLTGEGDDLARDGRRPCVVLAHGFSLTVDSGLLAFAERFARAGIDALAFDYRHFGSSDGQPRQLVSLKEQLEDFAAAIVCARSLEGVDGERIAVWGYSLGGGHVVPTAIGDGRVVAAIALTPAMDGVGALLMLLRTAGAGQLARVTLAGLRDALAGARGQAPVMLSVTGPPGSLAALTSADAEPGFRAIVGPSWRNEVAARIALALGRYRPGLQADRLPCPILVQIADRDAVVSVKAIQDAAFRASGRAEVRTYPVGHFDVFVGETFERAVADQLHFLRRHLGASADARVLARA